MPPAHLLFDRIESLDPWILKSFIAPCVPLLSWASEPLLQVNNMLTQVTSHIFKVPLSNDKNPTQSVVPLECGVAVIPEGARWVRSELVEGEKFAWREGALGHHFYHF